MRPALLLFVVLDLLLAVACSEEIAATPTPTPGPQPAPTAVSTPTPTADFRTNTGAPARADFRTNTDGHSNAYRHDAYRA